MTAALVQKLSEIKDLRGLVETAVNELGQSLNANCTQILLANPLDPNSAVICETYSPPGSPIAYNRGKPDKYSRLNLPLDINGRGFGTLSLSRATPWLPEEVDSTRLLAGKVGELIRQAQLNDIAQRETFRETFLVEINNLMSYSLGVGDALFMVVNILGKALRCSRCIFVCTDDKSAGWKCYEYWQQDKVKSCQECRWPTNDSSLIAQTLSSDAPLRFYEGQANSYLTPAQAELQFSNTRSLLSLPLLNDNNVYGCVIIQQCDYRRHWTISEIDTVQNVADRVAEALAKLPEEKRIHKPIMQLHQRIVAAAKTSDSAATASLAQSLKGAFGQQSIPSAARETLHQLPAQALSKTPISMKPGSEAIGHEAPEKQGSKSTAQQQKRKPGRKDEVLSVEAFSAAPSIVPVQRKSKTKGQSQATEARTGTSEKSTEDPWGDLNSIPTPSTGPVMSGLQGSMLPKVKAQAQSTTSPLRASLHKQKNASTSLADLPAQRQIEEKFDLPSQEALAEIEAETDLQAREKVEKVLSTKTEGKTSSEYIFSIPNIDMRTLGRINGWVEAIEQKDRYLTPHAIQVAEYACDIAKAINLPAEQIEEIRLAALVHDVGKLGISGDILQKADEDLDDAELLTTMRHPIDGAELLESSTDLSHLAPIVLAHHEEFDGNGYPGGLKGEEIPLAARIIYIANSYHGMITNTKSGKGITLAEAQEQMRKDAGKQYDPALVEAFVGSLNA